MIVGDLVALLPKSNWICESYYMYISDSGVSLPWEGQRYVIMMEREVWDVIVVHDVSYTYVIEDWAAHRVWWWAV